MGKLLEKIDLFSYKINFIYRHSLAFSSYYSYIISLLIYSMLIFLIHYFSKDLVNRDNPRLNFMEAEFSEIIEISFDQFIKTIEIKLNGTFEKTSSLWLETILQEKYNDTALPFNLTNYLSAQNITLDMFLNIQIKISNNNDEMNLDDDHPEFLKETLTMNFTNKLDFIINEDNSFYMNKKINSFSNFNLNDKDEIIDINEKSLDVKDEKFFNLSISDFKFNITKNTKIELFMNIDYDFIANKNLSLNINKLDRKFKTKDNEINQNEEEFFTSTIQEKKYTSPMNPNSITKIKYTYGLYDIRDDKGLIFTSYNNFFDFHKRLISSESLSIMNRKNISLFMINFQSIKKNYFRIYKKLQNVFADLGGIFSSILMLGRILVFSVNKKLFDYDAINFLFRMDEAENQIENKYIGKDIKSKIKSFNDNESQINIKNKNNFPENECKIINENSFYQVEQDPKRILYAKLTSNRNTPFNNSRLSETYRNLFVNRKVNGNNSKLMKLDIDNYLGKEKNEVELNFFKRKQAEEGVELTSTFNDKNNNDFKINKNKDNKFESKLLSNNCKEKKDNFINCSNGEADCTQNNPKALVNKDEILKEKIKNISAQVIKNKNEINSRNKNFSKKKFINFSYCDFLNTFICLSKCKSKALIEKEQIFENMQKKIYEYLNVLNYFDIYEDLERMKKIIFNEHQFVLSNFIKKRPYNEITEFNFENKLFETIKHYKSKEIIKNDYLDERILNSLTKYMKDLMDI